MPDGPVASTRIAWLELADERRLVREGYDLLDEKRMLLASEIMKALRLHKVLRKRWLDLLTDARGTLAATVGRHGFEALWAYPPGQAREEQVVLKHRGLLGLALFDAELEGVEPLPAFPPPDPSPEAGETARAFRALLTQAAALAGIECSLRRMAREYVRTERRARALENVLLPEIDASLRQVESQLEAIDQEEAVRVRKARSGGESRLDSSAGGPDT
ncbi:MAG: V-type ATP synthase subunit D [Gammaproteobacteria bacterium]|nr:V-type ATP synthase subunit D [Gammaproteobacteria bacterium]